MSGHINEEVSSGASFFHALKILEAVCFAKKSDRNCPVSQERACNIQEGIKEKLPEIILQVRNRLAGF